MDAAVNSAYIRKFIANRISTLPVPSKIRGEVYRGRQSWDQFTPTFQEIQSNPVPHQSDLWAGQRAARDES